MSVDICLVSPPQRAYNHNRPPLALMLLASYLLKNGLSVEIVDPKSEVPVKGMGRFQNEERALTMVYWQLKELRWYGVSMTSATKAILARIRTSKMQRIAA